MKVTEKDVAYVADLANLERQRLARQLTGNAEAVHAALETFAVSPNSITQEAVQHVRSWARDAARDARRLHEVLA